MNIERVSGRFVFVRGVHWVHWVYWVHYVHYVHHTLPVQMLGGQAGKRIFA